MAATSLYLPGKGENTLINWMHSRIFRPERGWDPVPSEYAEQYAAIQWTQGAGEALLDKIEDWCGGLRGKTVLDLGAGPGHYTMAFARRGARVTWYDISAHYRTMAQERARQQNVAVEFVLGYLDEAPARLGKTYDVVFNSICWNYGRGDRSFARVIYRLIHPGGVAYVDTTHDLFNRHTLTSAARFRSWLNSRVGIKIGHPFPPHGRLARLFLRFPLEAILIDYGSPWNDRLLLRKAYRDGRRAP